jgi:hypothetical protein
VWAKEYVAVRDMFGELKREETREKSQERREKREERTREGDFDYQQRFLEARSS